jgi:VWFA-related protein
MGIVRRVGRFLAVASLVAVPSAETSPQNPPEARKIKSATELVVVPVIVHKGGTHLTGLKKENFELLDDGKPVTIAIFDEVHAALTTEVVRPAEGEFTNTRHGNDAQRLTVIAMDLVNTAPLDQLYLKPEIIKFLDEAPESDERYSLVAMTAHGIRILRDFTSDPKMIVAALKKKDIQPNGREATGSTGQAAFDQTPCAASAGNCGSHSANDLGWNCSCG